MSIDPVCGMSVDEATAPKTDFEGKTYYFCCNACMKTFSQDPAKYLNQESHGNHSHEHGHGHHHN